MKIIKISLFAFSALLVAVGVATPVSAVGLGVDVGVSGSSEVRQDGINASATSSVKTEVKTTTTNNSSDSYNNNASATSSNNVGQNKKAETTAEASAEVSASGESHRNAVAVFVKSLLNVANRDAGIGQEVRVIANEQNDSATTTVSAMNTVETRSGLKTLLVGSDYKTLGVIRSEMAKTSNRIDRLNAAIEKTTNPSVKAELEAQVEVLVDAQAKVEDFVEDHETSFSFFGWFTRLFSK